MNKHTQSTPAQRTEPAQPEPANDGYTYIVIPVEIIYVLVFGCMAVAIVGALAGAFTR